MGAKTTLCVSRNAALLALAHVELGHLSDEEIQDRLDAVVGEKLYNVEIRGETYDDDAKWLGYTVGADIGDMRI